jgi:hypothetical protein
MLGGWEKLHTEELHNLYFSPSIIRMNKSRKMRWAEYASRMEEKRNACRNLVGKSEGKDHYEGLYIGRRKILGWILEKQDGCYGLD